MTRWYVDIFPCNACEHCPMVGDGCRKGQLTLRVDGCGRCGTLVNMDWYFDNKECPDFEQHCFDDPSGS